MGSNALPLAKEYGNDVTQTLVQIRAAKLGWVQLLWKYFSLLQLSPLASVWEF